MQKKKMTINIFNKYVAQFVKLFHSTILDNLNGHLISRFFGVVSFFVHNFCYCFAAYDDS